jgi:hypothetical protein
MNQGVRDLIKRYGGPQRILRDPKLVRLIARAVKVSSEDVQHEADVMRMEQHTDHRRR